MSRLIHVYVALAVTAALHFIKAMAYDATIDLIVRQLMHAADPVLSALF